MRTLATVIIIFVLLSIGSWTSYRFIQSSTCATDDNLQKVEESISLQSWTEAEQALDTIQEDWDMKNIWWSILLDHKEIDDIELSLSRLEQLLNGKDATLSLSELSTLKLLFANILDKEKFSLKNIL